MWAIIIINHGFVKCPIRTVVHYIEEKMLAESIFHFVLF